MISDIPMDSYLVPESSEEKIILMTHKLDCSSSGAQHDPYFIPSDHPNTHNFICQGRDDHGCQDLNHLQNSRISNLEVVNEPYDKVCSDNKFNYFYERIYIKNIYI